MIDFRSSDPKTIIKNNDLKISRYKSLKNKLLQFGINFLKESIENTNLIILAYLMNEKSLELAKTELFSELPFEDVGSDSWKELWLSAKTFYRHTNKMEFPDVHNIENCPLCLQNLDDDSKKRFTNFETFVQDDLQKKYDISRGNLIAKFKDISSLTFNLSDFESIIIELSESIENNKTLIENHIKNQETGRDYVLDCIKSRTQIDFEKLNNISNDKVFSIFEIIESLRNKNNELSEQSVDEIISDKENQLKELNNKKKLNKSRFRIWRQILRERKINKLEQCVSKCSTRSVTTLSNELTTEHINENLRSNFQTELDRFGFKNVNVESTTKGIKGKQYHSLKLNEVNSEDVTIVLPKFRTAT